MEAAGVAVWVLEIVLDGFSIDACLEMKVYISLVYYKDYIHCISICVAGRAMVAFMWQKKLYRLRTGTGSYEFLYCRCD